MDFQDNNHFTTWDEVRDELFTPEEQAASDKRVAIIGERLRKGEKTTGIVRWFMFRIVWPVQDWWFARMMERIRGKKHE